MVDCFATPGFALAISHVIASSQGPGVLMRPLNLESGTRLDSTVGAQIEYSGRSRGWTYKGTFGTSGEGVLPASQKRQNVHNRTNRLKAQLTYRQLRDDLSLHVSAADIQIPNRQDLGDDFALVGQGYGFLGFKGPGQGVGTGSEDGQVLTEQRQSMGATWSHTFGDVTLSAHALGERLRLSNNNRQPVLERFMENDPRFDPNFDSSQEFSPNGTATSVRFGFAGAYSFGPFSLSGSWERSREHESLKLQPGSQLALNALAALNQSLAGPGHYVFEDSEQTLPLLDDLGNQVYALDSTSWAPQTSSRHRTDQAIGLGYQQTLFGVDIRAKMGYQEHTVGALTRGRFAPEVGLGYRGLTVSYQRALQANSSGFGGLLGLTSVPSSVDQWEAKYTFKGFSAWLSRTRLSNDTQWRSLVPGSLLGAYVPLVADRGDIREAGFSYAEPAWSITYLNRVHTLSGNYANGLPVDPYAADDELHQLWISGKVPVGSAEIFGRLRFGSGTYSSDVLHTGERVAMNRFDLGGRYRGWSVEIQNLFDQRAVRSWNAYPGTTFSTGRRLVVSFSL